MRSRDNRGCSWATLVALAIVALGMTPPAVALAQTGTGAPPLSAPPAGHSGITEAPIGSATEGRLPTTSIAPVAAPSSTPSARTRGLLPAPHRAKTVKTRHAMSRLKFEVEPASARLRLNEDTWIYERPSKWSKTIKRGHAGKFVVVTGSTHYFLRVKLRDGRTGYVLARTVNLVAPADKFFTLTRNSPVLSAPNRWGKKLAEVHRGHAVHVVGVSLNYLKIRMRSGLEGFIPASALE